MSAKEQMVAVSVQAEICLIRLRMKLDWMKLCHTIHHLPASHVPQHNGLYNDHAQKKFTLSRQNWLTHTIESKSCTMDKLRNLELWSDNSSVEIFVNDGEEVLSARIYPEETQPNICIVGIDEPSGIQIHEIHSHKEEKYERQGTGKKDC